MAKTVVTNNGKSGGVVGGKSHAEGGVKTIVKDTGQPLELEAGEVVINKEASKKHWKTLSKINQSAGNGVPIKKPSGAEDDDSDIDAEQEELKRGGVIKFKNNALPRRNIILFAEKVKKKYPKVWALGGNIYGNQAFINLKTVSNRRYWKDSEEWMFKKWKAFLARHKGNVNPAGIVAMMKWAGEVDKGWEYMRQVVIDEAQRLHPEKFKNKTLAKGGTIKKELEKGTEVEKEHKETVNKLYNHEITPSEAPKSIAKEHLKENDHYYTELGKIEARFENGGNIPGNYSFVKATGVNGEPIFRVFDGSPSHEKIYQYFKNELGIEITNSTIKAHSPNFNRDLFVIFLDKACKEKYHAGLKNKESLIFSYDLFNKHVFDFEAELENGKNTKVQMINGTILLDDAQAETMAKGGAIEPHREVSASLKGAISDVLSIEKYKELKPMAAQMLYNTFKNYKELPIDDYWQAPILGEPLSDMEIAMFKYFEDNGYIVDVDYHSAFVQTTGQTKLLEKGRDFIDAVTVRLETRKAVKSGTDLFPEESAIPELKPLYSDEDNEQQEQESAAEQEESAKFLESYRPTFWHLTKQEFLQYAEKYADKDQRLQNIFVKTQHDSNKIRARSEYENYYVYKVIKPMLHETAERNVFLLAVETGQLPYDKVSMILKSAGAWDENNRFVKQIIANENIKNGAAQIWLVPKEIYLQNDYFKNNFSASGANKWYKSFMMNHFLLSEKNVVEMIEKGIIKAHHVRSRLDEAGFKPAENEKHQYLLNKIDRISKETSAKAKLKSLIVILEESESEITDVSFDIGDLVEFNGRQYNIVKSGNKKSNSKLFNEVLTSINPQDTQYYEFFIEGNIIGGSLMYNPLDKAIGRYQNVGSFSPTSLRTLQPLKTSEEKELYEDVERGMVKIIRRGKQYPLNDKETVLLNLPGRSEQKLNQWFSIEPTDTRTTDTINRGATGANSSELTLIKKAHDREIGRAKWAINDIEKRLSDNPNDPFKDQLEEKLRKAKETVGQSETQSPVTATRLLPEKEYAFVLKLIQATINGVEYNKSTLEKFAKTFSITEQNKVKELAELSICMIAREYASDESMSKKERFDKIVSLYKKQVNLSHRTSESILMQQYSTPAPIAFVAGVFCKLDGEGAYFEPSAGNGLLTIAGKPENFIVNELDATRNRNLLTQGFQEVLKQDATEPFVGYEKSFDAIITNPPFGSTDPVKYGNVEIKSLEQLMALRALDCMTDNGRAAIIIGGHQTFDSEGRIQAGKNRTFFVYLYKHYNVSDVINIDGHALYSRQGTGFNVRLILIDGRKETPSGFPPIIEKPIPESKANSYTPVKDFETLWNRVMKSI